MCGQNGPRKRPSLWHPRVELERKSVERERRSRSDHLVLCVMATEQFVDKPTRGQSSHGLDNSPTGQLADSEFF